MAFTLTLTDVEALINLYQNERCLWDVNDDDYVDVDKRPEALQRIAENFGNN